MRLVGRVADLGVDIVASCEFQLAKTRESRELPIVAYINRENARELSRIGNAKRWSAARSSLPVVAIESQEEKAKPAKAPLENYQAKTLARVRVQLDLVNERLTEQLTKKTPDPMAIDRLAAAQSRLADQERVLAGRPLPGSLKPTSKGRQSAQADSPDPEPI